MTTPPPPTQNQGLDNFFASLHRSPVTRSSDRVVAGVCAGLADRLGVSTAIVRVGTVLLAILGPALALYLIAWLILPDPQGQIRLERAIRGGEGGSIVLLIFTVLVILPDAGAHARVSWWLALAVLAVVGVVAISSSRPKA
jgi:phage shock protein PspC (stress-responsive transcriptional regulator)